MDLCIIYHASRLNDHMSEDTVKMPYAFGHSIILVDEQTLGSAQPTIVSAVKLYWRQGF